MLSHESSGTGCSAAPFNEVLDADKRLRPAYQSLFDRTGLHPLRVPADHARPLLALPIGDKTRICPIPLVLSGDEVDQVRRGAIQRARALQRFFHDIVVGQQRILDDGPLDGKDVLPVFDDEGMGLSELRRIWKDKPLSAVRFPYGPDLNRVPNGEWVVTEDNVGRIGGATEAQAALRAFLRASGILLERLGERDELESAAHAFVESTGLSIDSGEVAALLTPDARVSGFEIQDLFNTRKIEVFKRMGLPTWDMSALTADQKSAIFDGRIKALLNFDVRSWKPKREFAEEVFMKRNLPLLEPPGVKIVGNKGFLPFIEEMIRFYLGEEPILRTQPTRLLDERRLPAHPERWVLKLASSYMGAGVFILKDMTEAQRASLEEHLSATKGQVVAQEYLNPSYLPMSEGNSWASFLVEIRPVVFMLGENNAFALPTIEGKATTSLGDPRNNVGLGAMLAAVLREET